MKRFFALLLAAVLLAAALPVLAEGADIQCALPSEIHQFFSTSTFNGCTVGSAAFVAVEGTVGGDYAFAVVQKDGHNTLYGFEKQSGKWTYWLRSANCLPQGKGGFDLFYFTGKTDFASGASMVFGDAIHITFYREGDEEQADTCLIAEVNKYGQWNIKAVLYNSAWDEAFPFSDGITYYLEEGSKRDTVYGSVETNLRYFSLDAFPRTVKEAKEKLSNPPAIPAGDLTAQKIKFTGGQKFEVYSGPGTEYERGGSGKAAVSTNDWIQVFGSENGWIMIQYDITSTHMRIGYIPQSALPKSASVSPLRFAFEDATVKTATYLTDDPLNSQDRIRSLSAGQQGVKWLGQMGSWVYVEVTGAGLPVRGFAPASAVSRGASRRTLNGVYFDAVYTAQAAVDVTVGVSAEATVIVTGPDAWRQDTEDAVIGYQLYANNSLLPAMSNGREISLGSGWGCVFTISSAIPANTSVLGLCPIHAHSGLQVSEMITIPLSGN